jgi:hypothetical protein
MQSEKVEMDLKEARKRGAKLSADLSQLSKEVARFQAVAEQAATRAKDILAGAALEHVSRGRCREGSMHGSQLSARLPHSQGAPMPSRRPYGSASPVNLLLSSLSSMPWVRAG